jgi:hypothetical protein
MAINKTYLGLNEDGTPHFHYESDGHVVVTGPVYGKMTTSDGTEYDVSEQVIEVNSLEHAGELAHQIGVHHEEHGHPDHDESIPFVHNCTDSCGALKREDA